MANHARAMEMRVMKRPIVNLRWMMGAKMAGHGSPMHHHPPGKRADMHHRHRSWQGTRQHKFHKPGANPAPGLFN